MDYEIKLQEIGDDLHGHALDHDFAHGYFIVVTQSSIHGDEEIELLGSCLVEDNAAICKVDANGVYRWINKGAVISKSVSPIIYDTGAFTPKGSVKFFKSGKSRKKQKEKARQKARKPLIVGTWNKSLDNINRLVGINKMLQKKTYIIEGRIKRFDQIKKLFEEYNEQFETLKLPQRKVLKGMTTPKQVKFTDKYNHDNKTPFKVLTDLDELDKSLKEMKYNEFNEIEFNVYVRDPLKRTSSIEYMRYFVSSQDDYEVDGKIGDLLKFEFNKAAVKLSLKPLFKGKSSLLVEILNDVRPVTKYRLNFDVNKT